MPWKEFDVGPLMVYKNIEDIHGFNKKDSKQRLEQYIDIIKQINNILPAKEVCIFQKNSYSFTIDRYPNQHSKIVGEKDGETVFLDIGSLSTKHKCPLFKLEQALEEVDKITILKDQSRFERGFILMYGPVENNKWNKVDCWFFKKPGIILNQNKIGLIADNIKKSSYQKLVAELKKPYWIDQ